MSTQQYLTAPCTLCGGDTGSGIDGAHCLCRARADRGMPTPCLGMRCPCCKGSGCHPRSPLGPINPNQDRIERWAPACRTCNGSGVTDVGDDHERRLQSIAAARKLHWFERCLTIEAPAVAT